MISAARSSGRRCSRVREDHPRVEERGDALTLEVFKSEYRALLQAYFGEGVVLDPQLDLECLRIPHFYSAFYVYKYATGISAAVALSERVLAGEPGSVDAYLNFLRSGGSKFPLETLQLRAWI
jgi:oligoendopeptidase F